MARPPEWAALAREAEALGAYFRVEGEDRCYALLVLTSSAAHALEKWREAVREAESAQAAGRVLIACVLVGGRWRTVAHVELVRRRRTPTGSLELEWIGGEVIG